MWADDNEALSVSQYTQFIIDSAKDCAAHGHYYTQKQVYC